MTIVIAAAATIFLPDRPATTKRLTEEQKVVAQAI
jgi:hypothetical protein